MIPTFKELVERQQTRAIPGDVPTAYIDVVLRNGTSARFGPYERWMAELLMGAMAFDSGDIYSAILVPTPVGDFISSEAT